jgi:hypothetical protein
MMGKREDKTRQLVEKAVSYEKLAAEMAVIGDLHAERYALRMAASFREEIKELNSVRPS